MNLRTQYSPSLGVAVTGATGFIGRNLVDSFGATDFANTPIEEIASEAVIVHLAADVSPSRDAMLNNIAIDTWLLELVNKKHKGLIYASGNNVYPYAFNCRINELLRCNDYYAASKIFGEKLIGEWAEIPAISVRIADVFGPGQRHGNFFKALENSIRTQTPLKQYGQGLKRRTYIHVQELCEILKFVVRNLVNEPRVETRMNLGYEDSASVVEILQHTAKITGLDILSADLVNDESALDQRTMQPSNIEGYVPQWSSFREALSAYINQIQSEAT